MHPRSARPSATLVLATLLLAPAAAALPGLLAHGPQPAQVRGGSMDLPAPTFGPCLTGPLADLAGASPGGAAVVRSFGFEDGPEGWTPVDTPGRPNLWHWTTFAGNGSAHDASFHGGPGRVYYGIENAAGGTYNTSRQRNQGELRSPPLAVPGGVVAVALHAKWHVEWDRGWLIDSMQLGYALADGQRRPLCFLGNAAAGFTNPAIGYGYYHHSPTGQAAPTGCEYSLESPQNPCRLAKDRVGLDLAFDLAPELALWEARWFPLPAELAGQAIQVSVYFQTGDAIVDDAMGWMVDDVALVRLG